MTPPSSNCVVTEKNVLCWQPSNLKVILWKKYSCEIGVPVLGEAGYFHCQLDSRLWWCGDSCVVSARLSLLKARGESCCFFFFISSLTDSSVPKAKQQDALCNWLAVKLHTVLSLSVRNWEHYHASWEEVLHCPRALSSVAVFIFVWLF